MSDKKVFNDESKSRLIDLYANDIDKIKKQNPSINVFNNNNISYSTIQKAMSDQPPMMSHPKSFMLDLNNFDFEAMQRSMQSLNAIPTSKEIVSVEMCLVKEISHIKFYHAEMTTIRDKIKYLPPRFVIDLSKCDTIKPNHGVRINTGYVIKIPQIAVGKTLVNNKFADTKVTPQLDTVIIPQIVSKNPGIIPTLYGRDAEDTGLLTINFTTTDQFNQSMPLHVTLNAYNCILSVNSANIVDQEDSAAALFKQKDSRSGRSVKNPKIKYCADKFDLKTSPGSVLLNTYDNTKKPVEMYATQKIKITNLMTIFTSRKREWCNHGLVTFAGIYNPNPKATSSPAMIANCSEIDSNTHGIVFIKSKILMYSSNGKFIEDCRIINGSFSNLNNYNDIVKSTRQITTALKGLSVGVKACQEIHNKNNKYTMADLLRVYDYYRAISSDDSHLDEKLKMSDEKLFESRPSTQNPYSAIVYKCLKILAYNFCSSKFTTKQLHELSLYSKVGNVVDNNDNGVMKNKNILPNNNLESVMATTVADEIDEDGCSTRNSASSSPVLPLSSSLSQQSLSLKRLNDNSVDEAIITSTTTIVAAITSNDNNNNDNDNDTDNDNNNNNNNNKLINERSTHTDDQNNDDRNINIQNIQQKRLKIE
ncbi:GrBNV gp22-like protein-like protein [Mauternbach virus]|uniref:GrBNV gp22-like protein-like protein n=1 Tax=Mauternbach virus TaxID=2486603 RepID=A0A3G3E873_9VIRU|nr:GrBNV gp22-like protein-like protein [Mauternbach virus]AYP97903.1 GrBNV gp22-like protein-like protein [Mauternbach virus]